MNIYNVIILDESGSMSSIYEQTISSVNEVLMGIRGTQKAHPNQHHYVSIVTFEGDGLAGVKLRRDRVAIEKMANFERADYSPNGSTPLYDAMGQTLNNLEGQIHREDRVMVTVITDGYENASEEYSGKAIKSLVGRLREKGWAIAYIGANQDAVEVARELNISQALNFEATPEGVYQMSVHFRKAGERFADYCADVEPEILDPINGIDLSEEELF
ncbi:MAG: VWA domain-containing protein [Bacteroidales bacterium]|nr:VWA domain-containing protein [Bacteroidales bacterium]